MFLGDKLCYDKYCYWFISWLLIVRIVFTKEQWLFCNLQMWILGISISDIIIFCFEGYGKNWSNWLKISICNLNVVSNHFQRDPVKRSRLHSSFWRSVGNKFKNLCSGDYFFFFNRETKFEYYAGCGFRLTQAICNIRNCASCQWYLDVSPLFFVLKEIRF